MNKNNYRFHRTRRDMQYVASGLGYVGEDAAADTMKKDAGGGAVPASASLTAIAPRRQMNAFVKPVAKKAGGNFIKKAVPYLTLIVGGATLFLIIKADMRRKNAAA